MSAEASPTFAGKILVVDDEAQLRRAVDLGLTQASYEVESVADGESALDLLAVGRFDLVVLDLILRDIDGLEVLRRLRAFSDVAVIVLSVRTTQADKVSALQAGADDYIEKPFTLEELAARVDAVLRRTRRSELGPGIRSFGELTVDFSRQLVELNGEPVHLTKTEYGLLQALCTQPRRLLNHQWLLRTVWGVGYGTESDYLRTFIGQLRRKLDDEADHPRWIETVSGVGYRWLVEPDLPT